METFNKDLINLTSLNNIKPMIVAINSAYCYSMVVKNKHFFFPMNLKMRKVNIEVNT